MAEMLIQSENLVAIADKIRVLSGTEDNMSLNAMENHVGEANEDVATEAGLIAQIASALEGKSAGGSVGGESYDTCTVRITSPEGTLYGYCIPCFEDGNVVHKSVVSSSYTNPPTFTNVICGSYFTVFCKAYSGGINYSGLSAASLANSVGGVFVAPITPGATATIEVGQYAESG